MAKIMQCVELASGLPGGPKGQWLKSYEPRTGESVWTDNRGEAHRFADAFEALTMWKSVHEHQPVRPDGKPNRPLTAFTISIEEA